MSGDKRARDGKSEGPITSCDLSVGLSRFGGFKSVETTKSTKSTKTNGRYYFYSKLLLIHLDIWIF
jgi:hypothetical protein